MSKKILIISGDPNSINSEIIFKTIKNCNKKIKKRIYILSNFDLLSKQFKILNVKFKISKVKNIDENISSNNIKIINVPLRFKNAFKVSERDASKYIINCLNIAHNLAIKKKIIGIINCPIDKKLIKNTNKVGLTEFFASKCKLNNSEVMMIYNKKLAVVPITTHIPIKNVSKKITKNLIEKKIITVNKYYKNLFKKKPRIGILGLNPHNAEYKNNSEEVKKIIPSVSKLKKLGLKVEGPIVSDTVFVEKFKKFDVIVGMYHDQVLSPFKSLFHFDAINITLGLSYIRVSPDHGPGKDLIRMMRANPISLRKCLDFIGKLK